MVPETSQVASTPHELLGISRAHALFEGTGIEPGEGVAVAVIDNGVTTESGLLSVTRTEPYPIAGQSELVDEHGSAVAGLIAGHDRGQGGPIGIAPGATIIDVRVYDSDEPAEGQSGVQTESVINGLKWVAKNAKGLNIQVANVSLAVDAGEPDGPTYLELKKAVRAVWKADVVLVAASGNRPSTDTDFLNEYFDRQYNPPRERRQGRLSRRLPGRGARRERHHRRPRGRR